MRLSAGFAAIAILSGTLMAQDRPLAPEAAAKAMTLPPGFKATLFAGEPDVVQPIAFTFDDRGRLWVVECLSYPKWRNDGKGNDRVVIFEDTDGDGKFDKRTVFYDKGSNLSGIEYGFGGIWLCSTPNLIFIPVRDDKPAGPPQIVLDGWDLKAKHNVFNSLAWGPDGWLYGCNGILSESRVGKPGTPDKDRVAINCGVWRYHPTRKVFEAFAHGTTNPWGLDFNEDGEMFITNCVIKHIWHVVPGAHFERMFGQDLNPHVYKLMPSIADHIHWGGGDWTSSRGGKGVHDAAGGGHAHSGCMVYLGDNWPDEYRGNVFMCNIHGNRINRDFLEPKGSTYVAKHGPDFMFANDPWFRGLTLKYGPDGGVFVADWTDTGECHNYEKVDQTNGRIFKITYGTPKPFKGDLSKLSDLELVKMHGHKNEWFANHARRILQERAAAGRIDPNAISMLRIMVGDGLERLGPKPGRLRAFWTRYAIGDLRIGVPSKSRYSDVAVRQWAIRFFLDDHRNDRALITSPDGYSLATDSDDPVVKLAVLTGLSWWRPDVRGLALADNHDLLAQEDDGDPYLQLLCWYAFEPISATNPRVMVDELSRVRSAMIRGFFARRLIEQDLENLEDVLRWLNVNAATLKASDVLQGIQTGLAGRKQVPMPKEWPAAFKALSASRHEEVRDRAMQLAVLFGDKNALAKLLASVRETQAKPEKRISALELLLQKQLPELLPILRSLLDEPAMRAAAIRGLASYNAADTPELILERYAKLTDGEKSDAIQTLASRPKFALALLDAVETGTVARKDISPFAARQILALKDQQVSKRLATVWGTIRPASKERAALMAKYKAILTPDTLQKADPMKGRAVFSKTCATCHKLNGEGGAIGPELTGSQRNNLDYLLENVLDPSAVVAREYTVTNIELKNGRTVSGIVAMETQRALTVQTPNEKLVIAKSDIETRTPTNVSMMPEGLFDKLNEGELRDLVAYLMKK